MFAKTNLTVFDEELNNIDFNNSGLHHFALEIDNGDFDEIVLILKKEKIKYVTEDFEWVKWKLIFIKDPEMNVLEFVCNDN